MDYDPFTEYEFEDEDTVQEKVKTATSFLKKNKKKIFLALALIVIGLLVYTLFFSGISEVTIQIKDTEGNPVNENSIELTNPKNQEIVFIASGRSNYNFSVKEGAYNLKVIASTFKIVNKKISIVGKKTIENISLEKDMDLKISNIEFPDPLFAGQEAEASIEIQNKGSGLAKTELVFENPKALEIESMSEEISIPGKSKRIARFKIRVPETIELKDKREGDTVQDKVRTKYLSEQVSFKYKILPFPNLRFNSSTSLSMRPGDTKNQRITVGNNNRFQVEGIEMDVEIISTQANDPDEVKNWFTFTRGKDFGVIAPHKSQELTLLVSVPLYAKKDFISGSIVYSAPFMSRPVKKDLTLKITEEIETSINLSIPPIVNISFDKKTNEFKKENRTITISNRGDIDLENIVLAVSNPLECSSEWFKFLRAERITYPLLKKRQTEREAIEISAPQSARDNPEAVICKIRYFYIDPITKNSVEGTELTKIIPKP